MGTVVKKSSRKIYRADVLREMLKRHEPFYDGVAAFLFEKKSTKLHQKMKQCGHTSNNSALFLFSFFF